MKTYFEGLPRTPPEDCICLPKRRHCRGSGDSAAVLRGQRRGTPHGTAREMHALRSWLSFYLKCSGRCKRWLSKKSGDTLLTSFFKSAEIVESLSSRRFNETASKATLQQGYRTWQLFSHVFSRMSPAQQPSNTAWLLPSSPSASSQVQPRLAQTSARCSPTSAQSSRIRLLTNKSLGLPGNGQP